MGREGGRGMLLTIFCFASKFNDSNKSTFAWNNQSNLDAFDDRTFVAIKFFLWQLCWFIRYSIASRDSACSLFRSSSLVRRATDESLKLTEMMYHTRECETQTNQMKWNGTVRSCYSTQSKWKLQQPEKRRIYAKAKILMIHKMGGRHYITD